MDNNYYNKFYNIFTEKLKNAGITMREQDIENFIKRFLLEGVDIYSLDIEYFEYFTKEINNKSDAKYITESIRGVYNTDEWIIGQYRLENGKLIVPLLKCSKEKIIGRR